MHSRAPVDFKLNHGDAARDKRGMTESSSCARSARQTSTQTQRNGTAAWEALAAFAYAGLPTPAASSTPLLAAGRCPNAFVFDRALRRSCVAGASFALRLGLRVADRLRLRVDRLGLRVADRLGQHLEQVSLGRCGRFCHFATISLSTSRLPWPIARPSIARSFFGRPPALSRIPLLPSVCRRAEKSFPPLVARGPSLFYRSWITSISVTSEMTIARLRCAARKPAD